MKFCRKLISVLMFDLTVSVKEWEWYPLSRAEENINFRDSLVAKRKITIIRIGGKNTASWSHKPTKPRM